MRTAYGRTQRTSTESARKYKPNEKKHGHPPDQSRTTRTIRHRGRMKKPRLQITSNVRLNITSNAKTSHPSPLISVHKTPHTPPRHPQGPPRNVGHRVAKIPTTRHWGEATRLKCSLGAAASTPSHDGARKWCIHAVGFLILKTGEIQWSAIVSQGRGNEGEKAMISRSDMGIARVVANDMNEYDAQQNKRRQICNTT